MNAPANPALDSVEKIVAEMRMWADMKESMPPRDARQFADRLAALAQTNDDAVACREHRACCGVEHDPANGKLHGCCVICGVPWPCDVAKRFGARDGALDQTNDAGRGEPKIYTKADAEALCAIAVAAATSGTYESNCERIEKRLMEHRLSYTHGDDGDAYPLVDRLVPEGETSIETGRKEIELLAENIADLFGKPEPPSGAAVRDMSAVEKALDELIWQHRVGGDKSIDEARAALMTAIRALSTQPRGGEG